MLRGTTF